MCLPRPRPWLPHRNRQRAGPEGVAADRRRGVVEPIRGEAKRWAGRLTLALPLERAVGWYVD